LFNSSLIFKGSSVKDRIRQSNIDIQMDPPPYEECCSVIQDSINGLFLGYEDAEIYDELSDFIFNSFILYKKLMTDQLFTIMSKSTKNIHAYLLVLRLILYSEADIIKNEQVFSFLCKFFQQIESKWENSKTVFILNEYEIESSRIINLYNDLRIQYQDAFPFSSSSIVILTTINQSNIGDQVINIISKSIEIDWVKDLPPTAYTNERVIRAMGKGPFIEFVSVAKDHIIIQMNASIIGSIVHHQSKDVVLAYLSRVSTIKFPLLNEKIPDSILLLLDKESFSDSILQGMSNLSLNIPKVFEQEFCETKDLSKIIQILSDPSIVSLEKMQQLLESISTFQDIESIPLHKVKHPFLSTSGFWIQICRIPEIPRLSNIISQCFLLNIEDISMFIIDLSQVLSNVELRRLCEVLSNNESIIDLIIYDRRFIDHVLQVQKACFPLFSLLRFNEELLKVINNNSRMLYGASLICYQTSIIDAQLSHQLIEISEDEEKLLLSFLKRDGLSVGDFYDLDGMSDSILLIISNALMLSLSYHNKIEPFQILGFSHNNIIPFTVTYFSICKIFGYLDRAFHFMNHESNNFLLTLRNHSGSLTMNQSEMVGLLMNIIVNYFNHNELDKKFSMFLLLTLFDFWTKGTCTGYKELTRIVLSLMFFLLTYLPNNVLKDHALAQFFQKNQKSLLNAIYQVFPLISIKGNNMYFVFKKIFDQPSINEVVSIASKELNFDFLFYVKKFIDPTIKLSVVNDSEFVKKAVEKALIDEADESRFLIESVINTHGIDAVTNCLELRYFENPKIISAFGKMANIVSSEEDENEGSIDYTIMTTDDIIKSVAQEFDNPQLFRHECRYHFGKMYETFCVSASVIGMQFANLFDRYQDEFVEVFLSLYYPIEGKMDSDLYLMRPIPLSLEEIPPSNYKLVSSLLSQAFKTPKSNLFNSLKHIAMYYPFMFLQTSFAYSEIFDNVFAVFSQFESALMPNIENSAKIDLVDLPAAALSFIDYILDIPPVLDAFFEWGFPKIPSFDLGSLFAFTILIHTYYQSSKVSMFVIAQMIKYDLPSLICQSAAFQGESSFFKGIVAEFILRLALILYRILGSLSDHTKSTIVLDELSRMDRPCTVSYPDNYSLEVHFRGFSISQMFSVFGASIVGHVESYVHYTINYPAIQDVVETPFVIKLKDGSELLANDIEIPFPLNNEALSKIPDRIKANIFASHISQEGIMSTGQLRVLCNQPTWIFNYFMGPHSKLLLPEHYCLLYRVMQLMKSVEEEEFCADMLKLTFYCQPDFFSLIVKLSSSVLSESQKNVINDLIPELFINEISSNAIIDILCSSLDSMNSESISLVVPFYLSRIDQKEHLERISSAICPVLINQMTAFKNRYNIKISEQFNQLFQHLSEYPSNISHFIIYMLQHGDEKAINEAIRIGASLPDDLQQLIFPYEEILFKSILKSLNFDNPNKLRPFLVNLPKLAESHLQTLLGITDNLLTNMNDGNIAVIGLLLSLLSPKEGQSMSLLLNEVANNETPDVPLAISSNLYKQSPQFWKMLSTHMERIKEQLASNPSMVSSHFVFLTKFPSLIDLSLRMEAFRNIVSEKVRDETLSLNIRRNNILHDSFRSLGAANSQKMLGRFRVTFNGEQGIDMGGPLRDWYTSLTREIFNPNYCLFTESENGLSYEPNVNSHINLQEHIMYFKLAGKIIARAIVENIPVEAFLTVSIRKLLLNLPLSLRDIENVDETLYKSLCWINENTGVDVAGVTFTRLLDNFGRHNEIKLIPNGDEITVTDDNKQNYIRLMVKHRLKEQYNAQITAFVEGFHMILPPEELRMFSPHELGLLISGVPELDIDDLENNIVLEFPYTKESPTIIMLFKLLRSWDKEKRVKFLFFVTGSSRVPIGGFRDLSERGKPIRICKCSDTQRLPVSHTCANLLDLPDFQDEALLESKLLYAVNECNTFEIF